MLLELIKTNLSPRAWNALMSILGDPPELTDLRSELTRTRQSLTHQLEDAKTQAQESQKELDRVREDRLQVMAKEASARKELQDCQVRSKDLLDQVVRLTHQHRDAKKNLLDQTFKTSTTPLERNRFEIELTDARVKVKRAEERARTAEEKMSRMQSQQSKLQRKAGRVKHLETDLAWVRQQSFTHLQAVGAAVVKVKQLERKLAELTKGKKAKRSKAKSKDGGVLGYKRPSIRKSTKKILAAWESLSQNQ